jgi:hypothetical protein
MLSDLNTHSNAIDLAKNENIRNFQLSRSKTMPPLDFNKTILNSRKIRENTMASKSTTASIFNQPLNINPDRLKVAKEEAERAIKVSLALIFYCLFCHF